MESEEKEKRKCTKCKIMQIKLYKNKLSPMAASAFSFSRSLSSLTASGSRILSNRTVEGYCDNTYNIVYISQHPHVINA